MSSKLGRKLAIILAMNIRGICCYEILAENETMNSVYYFKFIGTVIESTQYGYQTTLDLIVMLQLLPGLSNEVFHVGFYPLRVITGLSTS